MYARISIRSFCTFSFTILIDADICPEAGFFGVEVGLKGSLRQWNLHVFSLMRCTWIPYTMIAAVIFTNPDFGFCRFWALDRDPMRDAVKHPTD